MKAKLLTLVLSLFAASAFSNATFAEGKKCCSDKAACCAEKKSCCEAKAPAKCCGEKKACCDSKDKCCGEQPK